MVWPLGPTESYMLRRSSTHRRWLFSLLDMAERARMRVRQKGGLTTRDYFFWHPALDEFAKASVARSQAQVFDVAFSSPRVFMPLSTLAHMAAEFAVSRRTGHSASRVVSIRPRWRRLYGTPD